MKLGSVSNLEKRKKQQLQCHIHLHAGFSLLRGWEGGGGREKQGGVPLTSRKFAHPPTKFLSPHHQRFHLNTNFHVITQ